jgi:hypothetical protein
MVSSDILEFNSIFKPSEFHTENFSTPYCAGMRWHERMNQRLADLGWSIPDLARRMGKDDQATVDRLYKYSQGAVQNPRGEQLKDIADAIGLTEAQLRFGDGFEERAPPYEKAGEVPTLGIAAAGVWRDVGMSDSEESHLGPSPLPPDPRFPAAAQYDLIVEGTSIDRVAKNGGRLRVVDVRKLNIEIPDRELVIVERKRHQGGLIETTAKRLRRKAGGYELRTDSDDPRWHNPSDPEGQTVLKPGHSDDDTTVEVIGWVIHAFQPLAGKAQ